MGLEKKRNNKYTVENFTDGIIEELKK